ncbi:hypothetical protein CYJ36_00920 [Bacillus sp. UMB0893]|nr:hypothetical protein CYJ36_00920 [Bacillus sp. UMB0893]
MSKQGMQNLNQTREQIEKQDKRNGIDFENEYQIGNTSSHSPKKADVKQIKNNLNFLRLFFPYFTIHCILN